MFYWKISCTGHIGKCVQERMDTLLLPDQEVLADFVKRGFLKKTEHGYYIQDLNTLRKIAEGIEP